MQLSQLFSLFSQLQFGENPQCEVTGVTQDSRQASPGMVYVAIKGTSQDGHRFLPEVCARGVAGVVVQDRLGVPADFAGAVAVVPDTRVAINRLAARFFGDPAKELFCVGVTGTNGKTTLTHMVEAVLGRLGWPTGVMGTIDHHVLGHRWESSLTTPDPVLLQQRLREFADLGAKAVAFEVSSHALDQRRVDQIPFDAVVFTNLTRDHLDYHGSMEGYFAAKERLFREFPQGDQRKEVRALVNADDPWSSRFRFADRLKVWTYGQGEADLRFTLKEMGFHGSRVKLATPRGEAEFLVPMPGLFNVSNAVAAIGVGLHAGAGLATCVRAIEEFLGVPGRLQRVDNSRGLSVFVDYAHTDDALRSVLKALQEVRRQANGKQKITVVFGCGGDRDRGKRPLMGGVAAELADRVVVTSDNPRSEDPDQIIEEIVSGIPDNLHKQKVMVEVDRRRAIARAIEEAAVGDVVLIAGKGHENYQMMGSEKLPFDDVQVAQELMKRGV